MARRLNVPVELRARNTKVMGSYGTVRLQAGRSRMTPAYDYK